MDSFLGNRTAFHRGCFFDEETRTFEERQGTFFLICYKTLEEFKDREDVQILPASEIKEEDLRPLSRKKRKRKKPLGKKS